MDKNFGHYAKDKITGYQGVITASCSYLYGCDQYCLTPMVNEKGEYQDGRWFDVGRVEVGGVCVTPESVQVEVGGCETREHP